MIDDFYVKRLSDIRSDELIHRSDIGKPFPAHFQYETDMRSIGPHIGNIIVFITVYLYLKLYLTNTYTYLLAQTDLSQSRSPHIDNRRHLSIFTTPSRLPTINTSTTPETPPRPKHHRK
jgi:hypothetical protein